ncbi:MAG: CBS domain-containing protein [Gammaproteobacteria bacterium]|nr:CBS domain-containing protein [Gammaproteobacteria bacterium]
MTASLVYDPPARVLHESDSVAIALDALIETGAGCLPVVDRDDRVLGTFGVDRLLGMLLPRAVTAGRLPDLAFVSDTLSQVREKLSGIANDAIGPHAERIAHPIHPDTPLLEVLLLVHRGENEQPVSDRTTGKLVGVVSARRLLASIGRVE